LIKPKKGLNNTTCWIFFMKTEKYHYYDIKRDKMEAWVKPQF
jgi:hypothetical protein